MSLAPPSLCSHPTNASPVPEMAAAGLRSPLSALASMTWDVPHFWVLPVRRLAAACQLPPTDSVQAATASPFAFIEITGPNALVVVIEAGLDQFTPSLELLCQIPNDATYMGNWQSSSSDGVNWSKPAS